MAFAVENIVTTYDAGPALTVTTSGTNRIVVLAILTRDTAVSRTVSSVTSSGLTWAKRSGQTFHGAAFSNLEIWWAYAAAQQSAAPITVTFSATPNSRVLYNIFAVSGSTSSSNPWDGNISLPTISSNPSSTPSVPTATGVSTNGTDDLLMAFLAIDDNFVEPGVAPGFTSGGTQSGTGGAFDKASLAAEYQVQTASLSSATVGWDGSTTQRWEMIVDAISNNGVVPIFRTSKATIIC